MVILAWRCFFRRSPHPSGLWFQINAQLRKLMWCDRSHAQREAMTDYHSVSLGGLHRRYRVSETQFI